MCITIALCVALFLDNAATAGFILVCSYVFFLEAAAIYVRVLLLLLTLPYATRRMAVVFVQYCRRLLQLVIRNVHKNNYYFSWSHFSTKFKRAQDLVRRFNRKSTTLTGNRLPYAVTEQKLVNCLLFLL